MNLEPAQSPSKPVCSETDSVNSSKAAEPAEVVRSVFANTNFFTPPAKSCEESKSVDEKQPSKFKRLDGGEGFLHKLTKVQFSIHFEEFTEFLNIIQNDSC